VDARGAGLIELPPRELEAVFGAGDTACEVESLRERSFASTVGVWRVRSEAGSAVRKLIRLGAAPVPRWPSEPERADPYYWRREALVYESGLLERLDGLRAPRLLGLFERMDGSVALWLEDVPASPSWTPDRLGAFAERLGRAQGALVRSLPDENSLGRGFLRRYVELHEIGGADSDAVLARLDALPHTFAHNDLHPANVHGDGAVVLDWAFCGLAPLGLDPGVLVGDGVADSAITSEDADAAADAVWAGYASGLRDAGFAGDLTQIRWAFLRGTALRLSWLDPERTREDRTRDAWRATVAMLDRWSEAARELPSEP
jgi:Ser/Thr protein kinase RdoA (MazF antagonist)